MAKTDWRPELPEWLRNEGEFADVAISSRIRLARNIKGIPFPGYANEDQLAEVENQVITALHKDSPFGELALIPIADISAQERLAFVELHLCSPQFVREPRHRLLAVNSAKTISLMVNEEDHLRIQAIAAGFDLDKAWELANQADDFLEANLDLCFDDCCGYLTACPSNVGTGLRASVMLHLPGLAMIDQVKQVLKALTHAGHIGVNIRGLYGEGTESLGEIYQISNSITLGHSEQDVTANLKSVCRQLIERERVVRERLWHDSRLQLEDRIYRSYGVLTQARLLTSQEALKRLSDVKLGLDLEILPGVDRNALRELLFLSRVSLLQQMSGEELAPAERDFHRAKLIRERLIRTERGE
jgi:protein arginine kinase